MWNDNRVMAMQPVAWWILRQVRQVISRRSAKKLRWVADKGKIRLTRANSPARRPAPVSDFILKKMRKTLVMAYDK